MLPAPGQSVGLSMHEKVTRGLELSSTPTDPPTFSQMMQLEITGDDSLE